MSLAHKSCTQCAGTVQLDAFVCRHCTYRFTDAEKAWAARRVRLHARIRIGLMVAAALTVTLGSYKVRSSALAGSDQAAMPAAAPADLPPPPATASPGDVRAASDNGASEPEEAGASPGPAASGAGHVAAASSGAPSSPEPAGAPAHAGGLVELRASANRVELPFPYDGGIRGHVGSDRTARMVFHIDRGPIRCAPSDPAHGLRIAVDGGPPQVFGCDYPDPDDFSTVRPRAPATLLQAIGRGRELTVEVQFYDSAPQTFRFEPTALASR